MNFLAFFPFLAVFLAEICLGTGYGITYQGRITNQQGLPLVAPSIVFELRITDSDANCVLYAEQVETSMADGTGGFSLILGRGQTTQRLGLPFHQVFNPRFTYPTGTGCTGKSIKAANEPLYLHVSFNDGMTVQSLNPLEITSVPYSLDTAHVAGHPSSDVLINGGNVFGAPTTMGSKDAADLQLITNNQTRFTIKDDGRVGIGTMAPESTLDVEGSIKVGADTSSCVGTKSGSIRLNTNVLEYCNGSAWTALAAAGSGLLALNGLTVNVQRFAIGSSGSSPSITSSGDTHTFNLPLVSSAGVTAGLLSKTDYDTFNSKLPSTTTLSGDVSGAWGANKVEKLQGRAISDAPPSDGNALLWDGTSSSWKPQFVRAQDIRTSWGGSQLIPESNCLANQTMIWSSISDRFSCQNIGTLDAAAITSGTISNDRLPASTKYWAASEGGINYTAGNVGIGTTTPAAKLEVNGDIKTRNLYAASTAYSQPSGGGDTWVRIASGQGNSYGLFRLSGASSSQHGFTTLEVSCNFPGINLSCNISVPHRTEHHVRNIKAVRIVHLATYDPYYIDVQVTNNAASGTNLNVIAKDLNGMTATESPGVGAIPSGYTTRTIELNNLNTSLGTGTLNIDAGGSVGIGTVSPSAKLEVNGQVKITGGSPAAGKVLVSDSQGLGSWQARSNYAVAQGQSGTSTCVGSGAWALAPFNNTVTLTTTGKPVRITASMRQYKTGSCAQRGHLTINVDGTTMVDPSGLGMASSYECNAVATLNNVMALPAGTHTFQMMAMADGAGVCTHGTFDFLMVEELP